MNAIEAEMIKYTGRKDYNGIFYCVRKITFYVSMNDKEKAVIELNILKNYVDTNDKLYKILEGMCVKI
jgi:hypothetical protein